MVILSPIMSHEVIPFQFFSTISVLGLACLETDRFHWFELVSCPFTSGTHLVFQKDCFMRQLHASAPTISALSMRPRTSSNPFCHGSKPMVPFWDGAPPILEPILVGIGIFTGGTIWVVTHGHFAGGAAFFAASLRLSQPGRVGKDILQAVRQLEGVHVAQAELHVGVHHQLGQAHDLSAQVEGVAEARLLPLLPLKRNAAPSETSVYRNVAQVAVLFQRHGTMAPQGKWKQRPKTPAVGGPFAL